MDRVEFKAPKGVVPDDIKPGDSFDLVSTYRLKDNGEICLTKIGDAEMPGYDEGDYHDKQTHRKSYGDMAASMQSAMSSQGGGPGNTDTGDY